MSGPVPGPLVPGRIAPRPETRRHVAITFPFDLGLCGGGPLDCFQTARHLQAAGVDVTLMPVAAAGLDHFPRSWVRGAAVRLEREARLAAEGVQIAHVRPNPVLFLLDGRRVRRALETLLDRRPADAVLGWHHECAYLPDLLNRRGVPFGLIAAGSYARHVARRNPWPRWIDRRLDDRFLARSFRAADLVFARSAHTAAEVVQVFGVDPSRVRVAHCGVDPAFSGVWRRPAPQVNRLLFFGELVHSKGIFDVLEALAGLTDRGWRGWTLRVAGSGDDRDVRRAARRLRIGDEVSLLGRLDRPALLAELEAAHLAVMPSRAESFGLGIAEAQAAGLPVVAYAAAAVPEVVEQGVTGWLAPPGDVEALGQAIHSAVSDPARTYEAGLAGRARAQRFSWGRTAGEMVKGLRTVWDVRA